MHAPVFHWYLPTSGDGRDVADQARSRMSSASGREPTLDYLSQVAGAADRLGFAGVLTPVGSIVEDPWIASAALIPVTKSLRYIVALRPGLTMPVTAAQMAGTFQRLSGGRVGLQMVAGGNETEQKAYGDHLGKDERYARMDEFLTVMRGTWARENFRFDGRYYQVHGSNMPLPTALRPTIYLGGASEAAARVAVRHADVFLMFAEPPDALAPQLAHMRELAAAAGREMRFGLRVHIIARDTAEQAWAEADRLLEGMDDVSVRFAQRRMRKMSSVCQQRQLDLHHGSRDDLVVAPNMWAGIGLMRGHAGTALVGSHGEVADRIVELRDLGFDEFILSGYPHVEESYRVAEGVLPLVRDTLARRQRLQPMPRATLAPV